MGEDLFCIKSLGAISIFTDEDILYAKGIACERLPKQFLCKLTRNSKNKYSKNGRK